MIRLRISVSVSLFIKQCRPLHKMLIFSIFITLLTLGSGYKVLLVFPIPGPSHLILGEGYVRHLLKAGHEVTYVTPVPLKNAPANLRQIDTSECKKYFAAELFNITAIMNKEVDLQDQILLQSVMDNFWEKTIATEAMQKFLNDTNEHFDVAIVEWLYSELAAGLASVFNCPLVWSSSMETHTFVLSLMHEHMNPSYTVHHMSRDYSFTFWDRIYQLWSVSKIILYNWINTEKSNEQFKNMYEPFVLKRGRHLPHFNDVRYNASLMLGNSDITVGDSVALPQNYKHIGGYHFKDTLEPLTKDLQVIMDNAPDGVIYFSMGSNLKSTLIPDFVKKGLLDIFSGLKQKVIWKLEKPIPNIPNNVHITSWAPQQSILAHPNCKLFITHGGLLSILETVNAGIPVIGMPMFADQYININRVAHKGFGKRVDFDENVVNTLKSAINDILEDPSYRQRAKEISMIFHDRLTTPGQELVHWVQHVVKTSGAPHLQSSALQVSWYKKMYLDLVGAIILTIAVFIAAIKYFTNIREQIKYKKN